MKIEEIIFDNEDKTLFLIDDLQLKADAIRYSILPKLEIINNELIFRLTNFYSLNFFENYSVAKAPHFRLAKTQRKEQTKTNYTYSGISITGQRKDDKWKGLDKGTSITPKISPTSISIDLTTDGLSLLFFFNHPKNFTRETYIKFYDFFRNEINTIIGLVTKAGLKYHYFFTDVFNVLEDLELKLETGNYDISISSIPIDFPIDYDKINEILYANVILFPLLNSCIDIALGKSPDIHKDIKKLEENILTYIEKYFPTETEKNNQIISEKDFEKIKTRAESKIKVQAGIRWQVFKRDNWKCVACGRSADDNIILHIDHILPRSKGGKDEEENYQTLCETCNIGKSNKDETNLRKK